jgi:hypothetical protein
VVAVLRAAELRRLFNYLEIKITREDLDWLQEVAPGFWAKYDLDFERQCKSEGKATSWRRHNLSDSVTVVLLIENIVDAKFREFPRTNPIQSKDRAKLDVYYADGMPKHYLMEIAEILGIDGFQQSHMYKDCNTNRFELAKQIMEKVEAG